MRPLALVFALLCGSILPSCATPPSQPATATSPPGVPTLATAMDTTAPSETSTTPEAAPFPLAEPGPYYGGKRSYRFEDASRGGRRVGITVWYPALLPEGSSGGPFEIGLNREPDRSGAPYPLILSSTKLAQEMAPYLVGHGFVWASVDGIDTWAKMDSEMINQPLDILFTLDKVATEPPEGLEGMIDAERAGVTGYSFDGYNTLALSGARIDPEYYLAQCPQPDPTTEAILSRMSAYGCIPSQKWDTFSGQFPESVTASDDGLWQPMTDPRIRAVMPLAGEGWWLFGARGLAAAERPTLMIVGGGDELYPENALMFEHLGSADKDFISFVGKTHMMIFDDEMVARMAHFATAFFGYHLQEREDYAKYFSEEFVGQHEDLAWGVYSGQ